MKFNRKQENLVAAFRGFPAKNPRGRLKNESSIDELMNRTLEKHKLLTPRIESVLMPQWGYILGEENAHRCAPKKIERGVLLVMCAHPVMVREMTFGKKNILKRLQSICPQLKDIKFISG
jgi:hypothetical protein